MCDVKGWVSGSGNFQVSNGSNSRGLHQYDRDAWTSDGIERPHNTHIHVLLFAERISVGCQPEVHSFKPFVVLSADEAHKKGTSKRMHIIYI